MREVREVERKIEVGVSKGENRICGDLPETTAFKSFAAKKPIC